MIKIFYKDTSSGKCIQTEVENYDLAKELLKVLDKPSIQIHGYMVVSESKYTFMESAKIVEFFSKSYNQNTTPKVSKENTPGEDICSDCKNKIPPEVKAFSLKVFKKMLCRECQEKYKSNKQNYSKKSNYNKNYYKKGYKKNYNSNYKKSSNSKYGKIA